MNPFLKQIFHTFDAVEHEEAQPSGGPSDTVRRLQEILVASPEISGKQLRMVENLDDLMAFRAVDGNVLDDVPDESTEQPSEGHFRRAFNKQQEDS